MEEERGLLDGPDGVDAVEGEAEEAVAGARDELGGDGLGGLDGLAGDGCAADGDGVGEDVAAGGGAVAVGDGPGVAGELLGGAGGGGGVEGVAGGLGAGLLGGEDPAGGGGVLALSWDVFWEGRLRGRESLQIRGASVKVQSQSLAADGHRAEVLGVVLLGRGGDGSAGGGGC